MYRVMLVDDEPYLLRGLEHTIDWGAYGLEIAAEAPDGFKALAFLETNQVDILFTDIKMPGMTGIELLKKVKKTSPQIKCVVFSGYNDFEYVKEAVKLGIENYLLKPIDEDELCATIEGIIEKLEYEAYVKADLENASRVLRDNLLIRWVSGNIGVDELKEKSSFIGIETGAGRYAAAIIRISGHDTDFDEASVPESDSLRADHFKCITAKEICEGAAQKDKQCIVFSDLSDDVVLLFSNINDGPDERINGVLSGCADAIRSKMRCESTFSRGSVVKGCMEVQSSYAEAKKRLSERTRHDSSRRSNNPIIKKILDYTHTNYTRDLSIKILAADFQVNPSYLGKLIKSETGEAFSVYLNKYRVEKAEEMLMATKLTAAEIAPKVGYQNVNYFYMIFMKITGEYPTRYRRTHAR